MKNWLRFTVRRRFRRQAAGICRDSAGLEGGLGKLGRLVGDFLGKFLSSKPVTGHVFRVKLSPVEITTSATRMSPNGNPVG